MEKGNYPHFVILYPIDRRKTKEDLWPEFKENYYNDKGSEYDGILKKIDYEKEDNFMSYIR